MANGQAKSRLPSRCPRRLLPHIQDVEDGERPPPLAVILYARRDPPPDESTGFFPAILLIHADQEITLPAHGRPITMIEVDERDSVAEISTLRLHDIKHTLVPESALLSAEAAVLLQNPRTRLPCSQILNEFGRGGLAQLCLTTCAGRPGARLLAKCRKGTLGRMLFFVQSSIQQTNPTC